VGYSRFWLSLLAPASPTVNAERRKYAKMFANIDEDLVRLQSSLLYRASI
jgi:aarF domain-containing kinase